MTTINPAPPLSKAEKSYVQSSLLSTPPLRADGRSLHAFRAIALETGVAPLANGSARVGIGAGEAGGATEVIAAVMLEVENVERDKGSSDRGRISCTVTCSASAYPHVSSQALDDLSADLTSALDTTLSHSSLLSPSLRVLPRKKAWILNLDVVVRADFGNVWDAVLLATRSAIWDTRVPITREVEYHAPETKGQAAGSMQVDSDPKEMESGFDTRKVTKATDFELPDYWDEGDPLANRNDWPIALTLNLVEDSEVWYLDATLQEEAANLCKLIVFYSFPSPSSSEPVVRGIRLLGPREFPLQYLQRLVNEAQVHARSIWTALDAKLKDEDIRRGVKARDRFVKGQAVKAKIA